MSGDVRGRRERHSGDAGGLALSVGDERAVDLDESGAGELRHFGFSFRGSGGDSVDRLKAIIIARDTNVTPFHATIFTSTRMAPRDELEATGGVSSWRASAGADYAA